MDKVIMDLEGNGFVETIDTVWCMVLKDISNGARITFSDHSNQSHVFPLRTGLKMLSKAKVIIGHNIILYDMLVLDKLYPEYDFKAKLVDTLILSQLQNFNRPLRHSWGQHKLEAWGQHFDRYKPAQEVWDVFEESMINRCQEDVEINMLMYKYLLKENKAIEMPKKATALEMNAAIISQQQVKNGWLLDKKKAKQHLKYLDKEMSKLAKNIEPNLPQRLLKPSAAMTWEEVNKALGYRFRRVPGTRTDEKGRIIKPAKAPTTLRFTKAGYYAHTIAKWFDIKPESAKDEATRLVDGDYTRVSWQISRMSQHEQVKKFLFTQGWKPTQWNFKKDAFGNFLKDSVGRKVRSTPKLTEDSFASIKGELGKQVANYNTYSHRRKTISNPDDLKGWLHTTTKEGRIVCFPRTIGAATARMTHGGLVNVPSTKSLFGKEMRELFIASPGYEIVACDMASAQLRLLAAAMGDKDYLKVVVEGKEVDEDGTYLGTDIHSINALAAGLIHPNTELGSDEWIEGRAHAKTFIYALVFGAGDAKIGTIIGGNAEAGKRLKAKFLRKLPALGDLIDRLNSEWKENKKHGDGWITGLDGRRVYCNSPHKVLNYKLQSDEAILLKQWMFNVDEAIKADPNINNAKLLLSYHDELNYETIPDEADALGHILKKGIQDAGNMHGISIMDGDYKIGQNWAEVH